MPEAIRSSLIFLMLMAATACASTYRPPSSGAPHANLYLQMTYLRNTGSFLQETIFVDGARCTKMAVNRFTSPKTRLILVRPGSVQLAAVATFEPADPDKVRAAMFIGGALAAATVDRRGSSGQCGASYVVNAETGGHYFMEYRYRDDGRCEMRCTVVSGPVGVDQPQSKTPCPLAGDDNR